MIIYIYIPSVSFVPNRHLRFIFQNYLTDFFASCLRQNFRFPEQLIESLPSDRSLGIRNFINNLIKNQLRFDFRRPLLKFFLASVSILKTIQCIYTKRISFAFFTIDPQNRFWIQKSIADSGIEKCFRFSVFPHSLRIAKESFIRIFILLIFKCNMCIFIINTKPPYI